MFLIGFATEVFSLNLSAPGVRTLSSKVSPGKSFASFVTWLLDSRSLPNPEFAQIFSKMCLSNAWLACWEATPVSRLLGMREEFSSRLDVIYQRHVPA